MRAYFEQPHIINMLSLFLGLLVLSCGKPNTHDIKDTVIIGGGLMGSSVAWHLANDDKEVLLLEKQDSIYNQGSSYGEARIARSNNRGNDIWSYLHNRSVKETHALIDFLNSADQKKSYNIDDVYTTTPVTYVGVSRIYDQLLASLERQNVTYKIANSPEEGEQIFNANLPDNVLMQREYNKHSGTVNPNALIQYLHEAVRRKNGKVKYNARVTSIKKHLDYYEINGTGSGNSEAYTIKAKHVVSAAGPYTGKLLKDIAPYVDTLINPQRVFLAFLKINKEVYQTLTEQQKESLKRAYPVINSSTGTREGSFFSMIENYVDDQPIIKIGGHFQRSDINDMDKVWEKELTPNEIEWSKNGTLRYFNLLKLPIKYEDIELVDGYSCVYSLTKTEVPYVTPLPNENLEPNSSFILMGGMSGVGAKGAMTYGLIGANLMIGKSEKDTQYLEVVKALGFDRLMADLSVE